MAFTRVEGGFDVDVTRYFDRGYPRGDVLEVRPCSARQQVLFGKYDFCGSYRSETSAGFPMSLQHLQSYLQVNRARMYGGSELNAEDIEALSIWLDEQLESGTLNGLNGYFTFKQHPTGFTVWLVDRSMHGPRSTMLSVHENADGTMTAVMGNAREPLRVDNEWLRGVLAGREWGELNRDDAAAVSAWLDARLERGLSGLGATITRKKEPRQALVKETKQPLRAAAFPNENIIGFKMPSSESILTAEGAAETYYLYGFDTEKNADAYRADVMSGKRKLFLFPSQSVMRPNPITDIWAKWNKPPKGCIGVLYLGVYSIEDSDILFIDMMSVRPEWQRYGVNAALIQYAQARWPNRELLFSDTTHAGHAFAKWWREQGREVQEQNAKWWRMQEKIKFKFDGLAGTNLDIAYEVSLSDLQAVHVTLRRWFHDEVTSEPYGRITRLLILPYNDSQARRGAQRLFNYMVEVKHTNGFERTLLRYGYVDGQTQELVDAWQGPLGHEQLHVRFRLNEHALKEFAVWQDHAWEAGHLRGLGATRNPRYIPEVQESINALQWWANRGLRSARDAVKRFPREALVGLFRRLRRWTWTRTINGEPHYLLYRGVGDADLKRIGELKQDAPIEFKFRTSFTPDAAIAFQFAYRYNGNFVGVWVPESAIVAAPLMAGPGLPDYGHGELEIITDPFTGYLQDFNISQPDFMKKTEGWMGREHVFTKMSDDAFKYTHGPRINQPKNPMMLRRERPTEDAKNAIFGEVTGQSSNGNYAYIVFKKVRVGYDESFRKRYGGRVVNKRLSFRLQKTLSSREGGYRWAFHIDDLGWYVTPYLTQRLRQLAAGEEVVLVNNSRTYKLQEEDLGPFSVWLDQQLEAGRLL